MKAGLEIRRRNDTYWAAISEETGGDEDEFVSEVHSRVYKYIDTLRSTSYINRVMRNWRYYHNLFFAGSPSATDVVALGEQGEIAGLSVNHHRNLLQHLLTMTTQNRPAWNARAINSERKSMAQARRANSILEFYMRDKRIEKHLKRAVEHALVFGAGYVSVTWNPNIGEPVAGDDEDGIFYEGDVHVQTPTIFDVVFDPESRDWDEDVQWTIIREYVNRWDLASRFPHLEEEIVNFEADERDTFDIHLGKESRMSLTDRVPVWHFYHKRTEALSEGRYALIVDDQLALSTPLPYESIPISRVSAGEVLLTALGYSPGFDLQGLQEALNNEMSVILSNHKSHGLQHVWSPPGNNVHAKTLDGGLNLVTCEVKPEPLNLVHTPPEIFNFISIILQHLEYVSGINSVARGQPEANLKSGTALALIDAKAVQFASSLVHSYHMLLEDTGTQIIQIIRRFSQSERMMTIIGKHGRATHQAFSADDLSNVSRVHVDSANALSKTLAGRIDLAEKLRPWMQNQEEYLNVIETGTIDPLVESERSQLDLIRAENETLIDGRPVPGALKTDNHALHVREHSAQLNSPEVRGDEQTTRYVLAHIMEHLQQLMEPSTVQLQAMLGFSIPPLPPTGDIRGGGGPQPGPGGGGGGRPPQNPNIAGNFRPPSTQEPQVRPPAPPRPPKVPGRA